MDSQISKLKGIIEAATSENLTEPNEQLLANACEAVKARADLPKEAIKIIKQRLSYQHGKVIFLCLELLEMATFYCDLPFQNQIATKDFLQQINSLLVLKNLPPNLVDKLLQLLSLWNRVFSTQKDILPQFFTFFENLKIKKPDLVFPPAYESKYEKYSNKKYVQAQIQAAGDNIKPLNNQDPTSKSGKLQKELDLVRDNLLLANSIIDEHDPTENVKNNGALTDIIETLKASEKKIQGIINDYNLQDETILNFCLELNDDINKTLDRYSLLSKGRKPNAYHPSSSIKRDEGYQSYYKIKLPQPIQPPQPKIQPPQQQNVFQKIDMLSTQQQQQPIKQVENNPPEKQSKLVNLLDDDEEDLPQQAVANQQKKQQPQAPIQDQEFQFQQAPVQSAPMTKLPQNSISDAISSLYNNPQQNQPQQPQFIPQMPNYIQPQQQMPMPQYNYMPQPQYSGMPNNMGMPNMMRPAQPMQQMPQLQQMQQMQQMQMHQMQSIPPMQSMQMKQPIGMQMPMQYSMNQPNQQNQGQMKQYGLDQINQEQKKPFDKIDDMFGL